MSAAPRSPRRRGARVHHRRGAIRERARRCSRGMPPGRRRRAWGGDERTTPRRRRRRRDDEGSRRQLVAGGDDLDERKRDRATCRSVTSSPSSRDAGPSRGSHRAGSLARARVARVASRAATRASSAWSRGGVRALAARRDRGDRDDDAVLDARSSSASARRVSRGFRRPGPRVPLERARGGASPRVLRRGPGLERARAATPGAVQGEQGGVRRAAPGQLLQARLQDQRILGKELLPNRAIRGTREFGYKCGSRSRACRRTEPTRSTRRSDSTPRGEGPSSGSTISTSRRRTTSRGRPRGSLPARRRPGDGAGHPNRPMRGIDGGEEDAARGRARRKRRSRTGPRRRCRRTFPEARGSCSSE